MQPGSVKTGSTRTGMRIAVVGATGMVGSRVATEAGARGHQVLALSRRPGREGPNVTPVAVGVTDSPAVREALAGSAANGAADAVVLTVRTVPVDQEFLVGATRAVLDIAAQLGIRVLVVGGAGALRSPDGSGLLVADNPAYVPAEMERRRRCRGGPVAGLPGSCRCRLGLPRPAGPARTR